MKFFYIFPGIFSLPITLLENEETLNPIFLAKGPQLRNGMDPDYEKNFPARWWEYADDYADDLPVEPGTQMGPDGPCHQYLKDISNADWNKRTLIILINFQLKSYI